MDYCPFSAMCRDRVPRVSTGWHSNAHGSSRDRRAAAHTTLACVRARPRFRVRPCVRGHDKVEGLSRKKNPSCDRLPTAHLSRQRILCRDKDCLASCRDRTLVLQQGLGLGD